MVGILAGHIAVVAVGWGSLVGLYVGSIVGSPVGIYVGSIAGSPVGICAGSNVSPLVESMVISVSVLVGVDDALYVGAIDDVDVGDIDGANVGVIDGAIEGAMDGAFIWYLVINFLFDIHCGIYIH